MLTGCLRAADVDRLRPSQQAPLLQACVSTLFPVVPTFQMGPSLRGSAPGRQSRRRKLTSLSLGHSLIQLQLGLTPRERAEDSGALAEWRLGYIQHCVSCQWAAG